MITGRHDFSALERVIYGCQIQDALATEVATSERERAFVVTNRSLGASNALGEIERALGRRHVGTFAGVGAHAPREDVIAGTLSARTSRADVLVAVGGGSVIDACKVMLLCLRYGYVDAADLDADAGVIKSVSTSAADRDAWLRMIAVPTSFSAAEYTSFGGVTETGTRFKHPYGHPMMMPQAVLLDPRLTETAPLGMLLATGLKAIDHAVERITNAAANPYSDAVSILALEHLTRGLVGMRKDQADLEARSTAQYGAFLSMLGLTAGVQGGLSHAIGHVLGSYAGVPHGQTTGVVLPSVLRWLAPAIFGREQTVSTAMGRTGASAADAVTDLVVSFGLPTKLRDVGVKTSDLPAIADRSLKDRLVVNSPRPVAGASDILGILRAAW